MISKTMRTILHALSYGNIEVEASRKLADLKKLDVMRIFWKKLDTKVYNKDYEVPVRLYFPSEEMMKEGLSEGAALPVILFFHGGGWVTESVETYDRVCARMSQSTGQVVGWVEYYRALEQPFPVPLEDCYAAAKALYTNRSILHTDPEKITVMGDSAGGNLAAAVALKARNTKDFRIERQILIYPALYNCYTEESPFASVRENGEGYLLTAVKMQDYIELYKSGDGDLLNPLFAPLMEKNLGGMPRTLILTAEFDPLRDEGEEYGRRLKEAGNQVEIHRIPDALHGYFALGIQFLHVRESFGYMNGFLENNSEC